jgi:hypothetical protein
MSSKGITSSQVLCPPPVAIVLHRGKGSSFPRRILNIDAIREALAQAANELRFKIVPEIVEIMLDETYSLKEQVLAISV